MKRSIYLIVAVFLVAITLGFFIYKNGNKKIELPKTVFDTKIQLQNSNISFKYPSNGLYNLGINITNLESNGTLISGIHTEPAAEFDKNFQSAYVVTEIRLSKNENNFKDIDELGLFYKTNEGAPIFDRDYANENGKILDINKNKYFIYKVTEDVTVWHALTLAEEGIIEVSLAYKRGSTPSSEAAYKNNEALFLEILGNVSF